MGEQLAGELTGALAETFARIEGAHDSGIVTFLEQPEVAAALFEERLEGALALGSPPAPSFTSVLLNDQYTRSTAAKQTELLPAIPKVAQGLSKTQYRTLAAESKALASGAEGLAANFVEQMVESIAQGFEVRLATGNLGEQSTMDEQGDPDADPSDPADAGGRRRRKGKSSSRQAPNRQPFVGIFNAFCRNVNADEKGRSLTGRSRGMDHLHRQFTWEYWSSALVVILYRWGQVAVPEMNYRKFQVPVEMEILDPLRVDLDDWRTQGIIWYEIPDKEKKLLVEQVRRLGDPSQHPFFSMYPKEAVDRTDPNQPQNIFSAAEAFDELNRKSRVPLPPENVKVRENNLNPSALYPVPFLARIFSAVNDKRLLRQSDRSMLRKVIMMILKVSIKSPDNRRIVREADLLKTQSRIEKQLSADAEYVQVMTTADGTDVGWVIPEMAHILDRDKYRAVDYEILAALVGLVSNALLSNSGTLDLTLVGKQLFHKNQVCLSDFRRFLEEIFDEIILKNNLRAVKPSDVTVVFKQFSLFESEQFKTFIYNLVVKGFLPAKVAIQHMGEDYDTVVENLVLEQQLRERFKIFLTPPTNNQITDSDTGGDGDLSGPGGRPPGSTDGETRKPRGDD